MHAVESSWSGSSFSAARKGHWFSFERYELLPEERLLLREGEPIKLGGRVYDLLVSLVENGGRVLSSSDLYSRVWGKTVVEESSLRVQLSQLRKTLGDRPTGRSYIATLPGKGYCFVAPVMRLPIDPMNSASNVSEDVLVDACIQAEPLHRMVGREDDISSLMFLASRRRLLTVAGPAGIGKSAVAAEAARRCTPLFKNGFCILNLDELNDEDQVRRCINAALEAHLPQDSASQSHAPCDYRELMMVIDNCDRHVGYIEDVIGHLGRSHKSVHMMVTARKPLNLEGEFAVHLGPAAKLLTHPSTRRFTDANLPRLKSVRSGNAEGRAHMATTQVQPEQRPLRTSMGRFEVECLDRFHSPGNRQPPPRTGRVCLNRTDAASRPGHP